MSDDRPRAGLSTKWRIAIVAALILLLGGLVMREAILPMSGSKSVARAEKEESSQPSEQSAPRVVPVSNSTKLQFQPGPVAATNSDAVQNSQQTQQGAGASPLVGLVSLTEPDLKLAVVDFPRLLDAYYKTKLARIELDAMKNDPAGQAKRKKVIREQVTAELKQVVLNYSLEHNFDLVLQSADPASSVHLVLYARPGLDVTDDVIAVANAGHEKP